MGLAITSWVRPPIASAQAVTATILGEVRDPSGGLVPGVTVSLVHSGTGFTRTLTTDAKGEYTAPSLPTGTYRVSAELAGFKTATVPDVRVGVDQKARVNLRLAVGDLAESRGRPGRTAPAADLVFRPEHARSTASRSRPCP